MSFIRKDELIIDSFAGGGGASLGIKMATGRDPDIAINHDGQAIAMHEANHPSTVHLNENIWDCNPFTVIKRYGRGLKKVGLLWSSPDCKHHSKARGSKPVNKDIRGLAKTVLWWAGTVQPRQIFLENVEEFKDWGPVIPKRDALGNKVCDKRTGDVLYIPDPDHKGEEFVDFVHHLEFLGYAVEWRELRGCDYGAPTSRKRLFLIARCDGEPIIWPDASHGMEEGLEPYRTAADCIDWSIPCPSIFERERPLVENTMARIARGIKKFVFDVEEPFIAPIDGEKIASNISRIGHTGFGGDRMSYDIETPLTTITSKAEHLLVSTHLSRQFGKGTGTSTDAPVGTIVGGGMEKTALVSAFMAKHYGGVTGCKIDQPAPTVTSRGTQNQLVTSSMIKFRGQNTGFKTDEPVHTISAGGTHIGEVRAFLLKYYGTNDAASMQEPAPTVTSKDRFGLVTVKGEDYLIVDIGMRMLTPRELARAQGFPDSYILEAYYNGKPLSKVAQVRMIGNSVCWHVARALIVANNSKYQDKRQAA